MAVTILTSADHAEKTVFGDTYRYLQSGADTGGTFAFFEIIGNPGSGVPPHTHEREDEAFYILEGEIEVTDASGTRVAKAGDSAFLPKRETHTWRVVSDTPARFYLTAVPAGIEEMFDKLAELPAGPPDLGVVLPLCASYGITMLPPA